MRFFALFLGVSTLMGCGDICLDKGTCNADYDCTTEEDGWTHCAEVVWDDSLDTSTPPILDALGDGNCSDPVEDGDNIWFCAAAGLLTHKAQTFGTDDPTVNTDFSDIYSYLSGEYQIAEDEGAAQKSLRPTGTCPDTLTTNDVFDIRWCDQATTNSAFNLIYAMNTAQTGVTVRPGAGRTNVGIWLELALQDHTVTAQGDDIWFVVFWSLNHFQTSSALRFQNAAGEQIEVISGLSVRAEWNAVAAENFGLTSTEAAQLIYNFVEDPLHETVPDPSLQVRLHFNRVDFADWKSGGSTWPGATPTAIAKSTPCTTAPTPWHACKNDEGPLAIIDPVTDGTSDDELAGLTLFVATAQDQGWEITFEGDSL